MRYTKHVFICQNERETPKACCFAKGSPDVLALMKEIIQEKNLAAKIRINKSGCLGQCAKGISIVVYPEGVWYGHVTKEDVREIIESHLIGDKPVERLRTDLEK